MALPQKDAHLHLLSVPRNQNPNDPSVWLMPKPDLVSTFSFATDADYQMGKLDCRPDPHPFGRKTDGH